MNLQDLYARYDGPVPKEYLDAVKTPVSEKGACNVVSEVRGGYEFWRTV